MRVYLLLSTPLLVASLLAGCSSAPKAKQASDKAVARVADADEQVLKQDPLERNYDPHVIMKRAESFFEKEDYAEAAVEYQHFLDLHRTHVLAPYAQYRLGISSFKQATTMDRDPEPIRRTKEAMEKLLREYPGSSYELDARAKIKECQEHIAAYEVYVGKHYYRQAAYLAALHRFEGVLTQYPSAEASAEARYYLALTYRDIGDTNQAVEYLTGLIKQFPRNKITKESRALLAKLNGKPLMNGKVPETTLQASKLSIPPPLPKANNSAIQSTVVPPYGMNGSGPQVTTCSLNVIC